MHKKSTILSHQRKQKQFFHTEKRFSDPLVLISQGNTMDADHKNL